MPARKQQRTCSLLRGNCHPRVLRRLLQTCGAETFHYEQKHSGRRERAPDRSSGKSSGSDELVWIQKAFSSLPILPQRMTCLRHDIRINNVWNTVNANNMSPELREVTICCKLNNGQLKEISVGPWTDGSGLCTTFIPGTLMSHLRALLHGYPVPSSGSLQRPCACAHSHKQTYTYI